MEKRILANAFATATALLWVICSLLVYLFPGLSLIVTKWWMHGMDLEVMGSWNLNMGNFLLGGLSITVAAWITGWIFGWSWEYVSKKK